MKKLIIPLIVILSGCTIQNKDSGPSITELADKYFEQTISFYPEYSYFMDIPIEDHSGISSNQLDSISKWEQFEDSLYAELQKIDESKILTKADRIAYWLLKEELESSIDIRVCKRELWNVSMGGFFQSWARIADYQPVGNATLRAQAIQRWRKLPQFIDIEIENLKAGIMEGYTMPGEIVELVINQVRNLADYSLEDSPFMSPAIRDENEEFNRKWEGLIVGVINPAFEKYADYLQKEYLEYAREAVSVLTIPNGIDCYQAYIRSFTTTNKTGEEIFNQGREVLEANIRTIEELGKDLYQSEDFEKIIALIEEDSSLYFQTAEEILAYNNAILDSAKSKCLDWFGLMPSTDVTIKPYLPHESGVGSYEPATENKPAYFRINLNDPGKQTYQENEIVTFHETYPGHHLQMGIQKDIQGLHRIRQLISFGSYVEGWGRYSEQLAEEMGLYNTKASLIRRRAWPYRGMVADPALHLKGWSKDSLVNFMMASGISESIAKNLYYRMIVAPAQLTSYDIGCEEIKALRKLAKEQLGDSLDIKEFHAKILENGSIPLSALRKVIEEWIDSEQKTNR